MIWHHALTDQQRDPSAQKILSFLRETVSSPEKLDVAEIARAAKAAQELMGLSLPGGAPFGLKDRKKINRSGVRYGSSATVDDVIFESGIIENDMLISLHGMMLSQKTKGRHRKVMMVINCSVDERPTRDVWQESSAY